MNLSLVFDGLLIALLAATLAYGFRLNRRLEQVRAGHAEFQALLGKFVIATEQAERGVATLKRTAAEGGQDLQEATERAAALREDLTFLVDRASELADRVESTISRTRALAAAVPPAPPLKAEPSPRAAAKPGLAEIVASSVAPDEGSIPTSLAAAARRARAQRRPQPEARKPLSADDQRLLESLASLR
jgi:hypothetical protein